METIFRATFNHPRSFENRPELPAGYTWEKQIKKYCPARYYHDASDITRIHHQSWKMLAIPEETDYNAWLVHRRPAAVFCHRGLYDQAMKIPENSPAAIENGIRQRLLLHEIDARLGPGGGPNKTFLAHDEVAIRVTSKKRRWSKLKLEEIWDTALVTRRFDLNKNDYASSFSDTGDNVADLEKLLEEFSYEHHGKWGCTFQIDLRNADLALAIAWYRTRESQHTTLMLKGYNTLFPNAQTLTTAVKSWARVRYKTTFEWGDLAKANLPIIMVFYAEPILKLALQAEGLDPTENKPWMKISTQDLLKGGRTLSYAALKTAARDHIFSFVELGGSEGLQLFIPEIVHSGLGLGYDVQKGVAKNPLTGEPITDLEVATASRLDRAMIEVSLELKAKHPTLMFSSCTRLCEVITPTGEQLTGDCLTGHLRPKPKGEKGIAARCRELHGGLYPRSDIVVADDPFAEIAARTWIDEFAKLDRRQLLHLNYEEWLLTGGERVCDAVMKVQGPFLANQVSRFSVSND